MTGTYRYSLGNCDMVGISTHHLLSGALRRYSSYFVFTPRRGGLVFHLILRGQGRVLLRSGHGKGPVEGADGAAPCLARDGKRVGLFPE